MLTFDRATYSSLLAEIAPKVIETEDEYDRLLVIAERLTFAKNSTPEERILYKLLVTLIEVYEAENYPIESEPHEILQHNGKSDTAVPIGVNLRLKPLRKSGL